MVDFNDQERLEEAEEELNRMLSNENLKMHDFLFFVNKQDMSYFYLQKSKQKN